MYFYTKMYNQENELLVGIGWDQSNQISPSPSQKFDHHHHALSNLNLNHNPRNGLLDLNHEVKQGCQIVTWYINQPKPQKISHISSPFPSPLGRNLPPTQLSLSKILEDPRQFSKPQDQVQVKASQFKINPKSLKR